MPKTMDQAIEALRERALAAIAAAQDVKALEDATGQSFWGKRESSPCFCGAWESSRPRTFPWWARWSNALRDELNEALEARRSELEEASGQRRSFLRPRRSMSPCRGKGQRRVGFTPFPRSLREIQEVFVGLGFEVVEGPEIETDYYNFEALEHPASPSGKRHARHLLHHGRAPLADPDLSSPDPRPWRADRASRAHHRPGQSVPVDAADATHSPMFHQVEGLPDRQKRHDGRPQGDSGRVLPSTLFGKDRGVRFRPSYFPFTEPSAEMDIECEHLPPADGCRLCGGEGWLEILGAGMVHPNVLRAVHYDPEEVGGFAFGLGIERVALLKYGIDDIRFLLRSDIRFLRQF